MAFMIEIDNQWRSVMYIGGGAVLLVIIIILLIVLL